MQELAQAKLLCYFFLFVSRYISSKKVCPMQSQNVFRHASQVDVQVKGFAAFGCTLKAPTSGSPDLHPPGSCASVTV